MVLKQDFFTFQRKQRAVHSGAGRSSKTFPDIPNEFRVPGCGQESRLSIPRGLGILIGCLGTWDNQNCLLFQDQRILKNRSGYSPCLVESSSILDCFALSASVQNTFSVLLFLDDSSYGLIEKLFLLIASSFLSGNDQMIDSPGEVLFFKSSVCIFDPQFLHLQLGSGFRQ